MRDLLGISAGAAADILTTQWRRMTCEGREQLNTRLKELRSNA